MRALLFSLLVLLPPASLHAAEQLVVAVPRRRTP
jgi:hypothetical protein